MAHAHVEQRLVGPDEAKDEATGRILLPAIQQRPCAAMSTRPTGEQVLRTIVRFSNIRRPATGSPMPQFLLKLNDDLGQTYRHLINDGLRLFLSSDEHHAAAGSTPRPALFDGRGG